MKKKDKNPETPVTEEEAPQTAEQPQNTGETAGEQPEEKEASIDEWRAALETAVKQRDEYLDQLRRSQADFQNFRRRNQTSRADGFADGVEEVIGAMLPVIDNLERAIAAGEESPLLEGVRMTLNQLLDSLKKFGLEEIPAQGEAFEEAGEACRVMYAARGQIDIEGSCSKGKKCAGCEGDCAACEKKEGV